MKRSHKHARAISNPHAAHAERIRRRDRRLLIRGVIALGIMIPLGLVGISLYERSASARLDLAVIGNGTPTVVEICDYSQRQCRQLRDNVAAVEREFRDSVQFRTADLRTSDGAVFAVRHNVQSPAVLLFAPDGRLRESLTGAPEREAIRAAITTQFPGSRTRR